MSINNLDYSQDSDVIEIIDLDAEDITDTVQVINKVNLDQIYFEEIKKKKLEEILKKNELSIFIKNEKVYFEYYLGCINTVSTILSCEVFEIKNTSDIYISYEITPKSRKKTGAISYNLLPNDKYIKSNDYIRIRCRNVVSSESPNIKNKKNATSPKKRKILSNNPAGFMEKIISEDKKYIEMYKCRNEVLKDIYEGFTSLRLKHNNREVSKLKNDLSKTLITLIVLNAIRVEIDIKKELNENRFGGDLKTFIHVILYPDAFHIDLHKYNDESNSLIKVSVDNLFKALQLKPLRCAKIDILETFTKKKEKFNISSIPNITPMKNNIYKYNENISKTKTISNIDKLNTPNISELSYNTPHKALRIYSTNNSIDTSNYENEKNNTEVIDISSSSEYIETENEEEKEKYTNDIFIEEKYRGGYLIEDFKEIYPNENYFISKLRNYQAEGVWWMYTRENPVEYSKERVEKLMKDTKNYINIDKNNIDKNNIDKNNIDKNNIDIKKINNIKNIYNARKNEPLNPVWEEHIFDPPINIYEEKKLICKLKYFYVNKMTGIMSLCFPQFIPSFRGGILADEMGLGKTVQSIGLITHDIIEHNLHINNNCSDNNNDIICLIENTIKGYNFEKGGTLIIAPVALVYQWEEEIKRHTKNGFLNCYVYYGNDKNINSHKLSKYSVVLTTYSTLVAEYKNIINMISHNNSRNVMNSNNKNDKKVNEFFKKTKLIKNEKDIDINSIFGFNNISKKNNDIKSKIINKDKKENSLYKIIWRRILIDEAHVIKNKNSIQSVAVWKLRAERKWCVTGTPIQNSVTDIFPLLRFLGIKPYGNVEWWNKEIGDCSSKEKLRYAIDTVRKITSPIMLRRTKQSKNKEGNYIVSLPSKKIFVETLTFTEEEQDFYKAVFYRSKTQFDTYVQDGNILSHYTHILQLLLRLRQCCSHPLLLFSKPFFEEWNKEDALMNSTLSKENNTNDMNNKVIEDNVVKKEKCEEEDEKKYILNSLQNKNIMYNFIKKAMHTNDEENDILLNAFDSIKNEIICQCVICLEDAVSPLITKCLHVMCKKCATEYFHLTHVAEKKCPQCDHYINLKSLKSLSNIKYPIDEILKKMNKDNFAFSTKLKKLFDYVQDDMKKHLHVVIFSQWITYLKIIQKLFSLYDIPTKTYDGSLSYNERANILNWFNIQKGKVYQPGIGFVEPLHPVPIEKFAGKVLLCSLKAGGVGLNLTVSSKLYLMDLWWNPAIEDQAYQRVHRIGQLNDVEIYKFVIEKTVEERILQIHAKKAYTANQILTQEGNIKQTEQTIEPQKLTMADFILMFKEWDVDESKN